jgi:hypothetical protein
MELIEKYRSQCYNGHFESDYLWISCSENQSDFFSKLTAFQAGDRNSSKFNLADIKDIFSKLAKHNFESDLTTKLVIQTANFDVKPQSLANGCTTRLLFFMKTGAGWDFYGHAKGRFTDWRLFNIKKHEKLGYSIFLGIEEQDKGISSGVSDHQAIVRILARLKQKNS